MKQILLFAILGLVYSNFNDCAVLGDQQCRDSNLCTWRPGQCKIGVNNCDGLVVQVCNAADNCKWDLSGNACVNTQCTWQQSSQECNAQNTYSLECRWMADDLRCISSNTCMGMTSQEQCRNLASHGCTWTGSFGCLPNDPCEGKSPSNCMSEGAPYRCTMRPGDCYGDAVANLDRRIQEGANYELNFLQDDKVLSHNE